MGMISVTILLEKLHATHSVRSGIIGMKYYSPFSFN